MTAPSITIVNVISVSYSGSTWLNLLLGAHPRVFGGGEVDRLGGPERIECTLHGPDCPVWGRFDHEAEENRFRQIQRLSGRDVIAVNNSRRSLPLQDEPGIEPRFIHLIRDGRAVTASYLRKHPDKTMWRAARWWLGRWHKSLAVLKGRPREHVLPLHYEKLAADTAGEVRRVCDFLGLAYEPAMIEYWRAEQHFIGGNLGTLYGMLRKTDRDVPTDQLERRARQEHRAWDEAHYQRTDAAHFRDERWKTELGVLQLGVFGLLAGQVNRRLGYGAADEDQRAARSNGDGSA